MNHQAQVRTHLAFPAVGFIRANADPPAILRLRELAAQHNALASPVGQADRLAALERAMDVLFNTVKVDWRKLEAKP